MATTSPPLPYYSSLPPFRDWFRKGTPVLMYHKLGPRPAGVRLKGLYVSNGLFRKQLFQFRSAGIAMAGYSALPESKPESDRVFLTFDDGFENVLRQGVPLLAEHGAKAIQFLVAERLGKTNDWETRDGEVEERLMDRSQIEEWLAAGHEIGAHTNTHPHLTRLTTAHAREEINGSRQRLEDLFGRQIQHFCFPYGDHDETIVELVKEAGYKTACTVESGLYQPGDDLFRVNRLTVRYASRNLFSIWRQLKARLAARRP